MRAALKYKIGFWAKIKKPLPASYGNSCNFAGRKMNCTNNMEKTYCDTEAGHAMAEEPVASYAVPHSYQTPSKRTRERVIADTMSVDEYFDELISQVHKDYASL